ncbi:hypothetical protein AB4Z54_30665, partial [Streptomyces sp. MCAF7]
LIPPPDGLVRPQTLLPLFRGPTGLPNNHQSGEVDRTKEQEERWGLMPLWGRIATAVMGVALLIAPFLPFVPGVHAESATGVAHLPAGFSGGG